MPTRQLTEAQIQAVKDAVILHLQPLGIELPTFETSQLEELLRHPTKTLLIYLPDSHPIVKGLFVDNSDPGYIMSLHNKGGQRLQGETVALMTAITDAVAVVMFDTIDVCAGVAEAYAFLLNLEFAYRDVRPVELGYMSIYMLGAHNDQDPPLNKGVREGRRMAWEAFQVIVADGPRTLDSGLLADCFCALLAVVLHLQPPVGVNRDDLVKTLLARMSTPGGTI